MASFPDILHLAALLSTVPAIRVVPPDADLHTCQAWKQQIGLEQESLIEDFKAGKLLVHMKQIVDPVKSVESFTADLDRWASQNEVDKGLSYSLLHPNLIKQQLWGHIGWLFNASKCDFIFGAWGDLVTGFGEEKSLAVSSSPNEVILATLLHRYRTRDASLYISKKFKHGVEQLAKDPNHVLNSTYERLSERAHALLNESEATNERLIFENVVKEKAVFVDMLDWTSQISKELLAQQQNLQSRHFYSEIVASCPPQAIRGFLNMCRDGDGNDCWHPKQFIPEPSVVFEKVPAASNLSLVQYVEVGETFKRLGKFYTETTAIDLQMTSTSARASNEHVEERIKKESGDTLMVALESKCTTIHVTLVGILILVGIQ